LLRITASSQGGIAIVAIRPFSAGSLSVGSRRDGPEALANVGFSLAACTPNPAARPQSSKIGGAQHHRYEFWVGSWGELVAITPPNSACVNRFRGNSANVANQIVRRSRDATFWPVKVSELRVNFSFGPRMKMGGVPNAK